MTVDEKSFYQYSAPAQPEKVAEHISAVREVTGIAEDEEIRKALDQTRDVGGEYNLPRAVDLLLGEKEPPISQAVVATRPPRHALAHHPDAAPATGCGVVAPGPGHSAPGTQTQGRHGRQTASRI